VEKAYTGFQTVNIEFGNANKPGVHLSNTHHLYYTGRCPNCGLESRSEPWRAPADTSNWSGVGMTQWRLIGPDLAALIVYLSMDMRVTRRKVQQFLFDVFGLKISVGTLQNCLVESARALEPVEAQLIEDICREALIHADETSHNEAGTRLWLWVFITSSTALFLIGHRTKEIFVNLFDTLTPAFDGYLMSDGYQLYRAHLKRLRCWAHLIRKAKGLCDSYTEESRKYGQQVNDTLNGLIDAIYQAREGPDEGTVSISADHQEKLETLRHVCEEMAASPHQKTRELGREFLNDWQAIFRVLDYPAWPLTNNEAERALRHWVILRKITQGTRSEQGSRALALFASVFATCRLRDSSPLLYVRDVIKMRRQGDDVPQLPQIPTLVVA
jgi:IS1 family transposase